MPSELVGQTRRTPVAQDRKHADIRIVLKPFCRTYLYLENKEYFSFDCATRNNGVAIIDIKIIAFSLTVLEKNPQIIKLYNTKSKFVSS